MKTRLYCLFLGIYLPWQILFGHDVPVHALITQNASDSARDDSTAYNAFFEVISNDNDYQTALGALKEGSRREDDADKDAGGKRSYNHFYDPLDQKYGKGLSDSPPDVRSLVGTNSFAWGSISNCLGINFRSHFLALVTMFGATNVYSCQNRRGYEWLGLTATKIKNEMLNL